MDVAMLDVSTGDAPRAQDKTDLIKTVRGLDQSGPGGNGENLEKLWRKLTASADGQFHAAEESSLRWLLKSMNGASKDAETLRRWPLTWTILECVFQRIPLFSLAKSLADRRFIAVLQQTLKDISQPTTNSPAATSSKRKRSAPKSYALDELKDPEGCLMTGDAMFHALKRLLGRLDSTVTQSSSHDKIGVEHIRSLFCATATEAAALASLSLKLCDLALISENSEHAEGREPWIDTVSSIWDLHLQGSDDILEVATHLFGPSAEILSKLEGISKTRTQSIREPLRIRWTTDIQKFMHRNLILPARALFITRQSFEVVTKILEVSIRNIGVAAPVLYFLTSGVKDYLGEGKLRKGNGNWMKRVFTAVEASIRNQDDRDSLVQTILGRAAEQSMPVDNDDLRSVCREYALREDSTNWRLVADISTCDADVFQISNDGASLLKEVCKRSTSANLGEAEVDAVSRVIGAIVQGFRTGRDFPNFLKLWFQQLCKVEKQKNKFTSPWLLVGVSQYGNDDFNALIEKEMPSHQILEVLQWVETEKSHSRALCLFLNCIAQGIRTEAYSDAVGKGFFDLVSQVSKSSSNLTALKWGVVSKTLSWAAPEERREIWIAVKKQLSKILSESPIASRETFEAFKFCCQSWISMSPDDEHVGEPTKLVEAFAIRLASELITSSAAEDRDLSSYLQPGAEPGYLEEAALEHYLAWFLRGSSRLSRLFYGSKGVIPKPLQNVLELPNSQIEQLKTVWGSLLNNENNLNDVKVVSNLIERLTEALEKDGTEKRWPADGSQAWVRALSGIPTDAFTRLQRERIVMLLNKHRANSKKRVSVEGWKLILGLSTKLMGRPTFYEGMQFSDIVEVADAMSDLSSSTSTDDGTLSDLITAFFAMSSATIHQMAEHIEDRSLKYFQESREFISDCDNAGDLSPFRLMLLKALVVETTKSPNFRSNSDLASLPESAKEMLGRCVMTATGYFMTEKKAFEDHTVIADLRLLAAVDAAEALSSLDGVSKIKQSDIRKAEKRSRLAMLSGDLRGWKMQTFLRTYFSSLMEESRPTTFPSLGDLPSKFREPLLTSNVASVTRDMEIEAKVAYLKDLVKVFCQGSDNDGQASAIQTVVNQFLDYSDLEGKGDSFDLATPHAELTAALLSLKTPSVSTRVCRILYTILEKKPQSMAQWNIESTLGAVCDLSSPKKASQTTVPYAWLCKLVEAIIRKHRLRLEGHHHMLMTTMQALLRNLIVSQAVSDAKDQPIQEAKAHCYARLVTLICEPTAGAVSRSQHPGSLDSATDAAKRSAGRHMYLVLMQYVKLQLEGDVARPVREALEPAMNSVFDITPPEVRKILNDAMDGSGRAILREMYKRYTKFGKWSGV
ncbi:hypothetical protein AK830_g9820 [Neonectria ditissima]|uniref:Nucleolar 27S pre-rRNA processing Urb2/Npa2 C-terminal domain-containing protein n=1 Tax=Neonectria ditissima TaxID=78410 RepID=A0A0P7ATY6_9HYPO|nr:hypothetical protein AK830_g9820 [Neonectria ditissima]